MTALDDLLDALDATAVAAYHDLLAAYPQIDDPDCEPLNTHAVAAWMLVVQLEQIIQSIADYRGAVDIDVAATIEGDIPF